MQITKQRSNKNKDMRNLITSNNLSILIFRNYLWFTNIFLEGSIISSCWQLSLFGLRFEDTHFIGLQWDISLSKLAFGYSIMGSESTSFCVLSNQKEIITFNFFLVSLQANKETSLIEKIFSEIPEILNETNVINTF